MYGKLDKSLILGDVELFLGWVYYVVRYFIGKLGYWLGKKVKNGIWIFLIIMLYWVFLVNRSCFFCFVWWDCFGFV